MFAEIPAAMAARMRELEARDADECRLLDAVAGAGGPRRRRAGGYVRARGLEAGDGALDEDTWVAIGGYGPTTATVIDGGELFGRSRQGP